MNYEQDMKIEPDALDLEWLDQPNLMLRYGKHEADMEKKLDEAKEELDLTKADLDKAIRQNPDKYDVEKITETVVLNTIIDCDEYKDAYEKYLEAKYEYTIARNAVKAIVQRKEALENLVRLNGQNYFAGPKIPRNLQEEYKLKQQHSNEAVGSRLKRNRNK